MKEKLTPDQLQAHALEAAAMLKQLGNPFKLMLLCSLVDTELSVGELNARVALSQSALSQHLAALREAELVATRKASQKVYYRLQGEAAQKIIATLQSIYCP